MTQILPNLLANSLANLEDMVESLGCTMEYGY